MKGWSPNRLSITSFINARKLLLVVSTLMFVLFPRAALGSEVKSEEIIHYLSQAENKAKRFFDSFDRIQSTFYSESTLPDEDTAMQLIVDFGLNTRFMIYMLMAQSLIENLKLQYVCCLEEQSYVSCLGIPNNMLRLKALALSIEQNAMKVKRIQTVTEAQSAKEFLLDLVETLSSIVPTHCLTLNEVDSLLKVVDSL